MRLLWTPASEKRQIFSQKRRRSAKNPLSAPYRAREPVGPADMTDLMLVSPCTGNTLAKLALSITDTPVTMAVKSHLRRQRPVVVAVSTNDALSGSAKNIGALFNLRHYYFVPLRQDDVQKKPTSLVADFSRVPQTLSAALNGVQIEPVVF